MSVTVTTRRIPRAPISAKAAMKARAAARAAGVKSAADRQDKDGKPKAQSRWKDPDFRAANNALVAKAKELVAASKADRKAKPITLAAAVAQLQKQLATEEDAPAAGKSKKGKGKKLKSNESPGTDAGASAGGDPSDSPRLDDLPTVEKTDGANERRG